jgi:hypothetical protein
MVGPCAVRVPSFTDTPPVNVARSMVPSPDCSLVSSAGARTTRSTAGISFTAGAASRNSTSPAKRAVRRPGTPGSPSASSECDLIRRVGAPGSAAGRSSCTSSCADSPLHRLPVAGDLDVHRLAGELLRRRVAAAGDADDRLADQRRLLQRLAVVGHAEVHVARSHRFQAVGALADARDLRRAAQFDLVDGRRRRPRASRPRRPR